jgi:hypothetical protein
VGLAATGTPMPVVPYAGVSFGKANGKMACRVEDFERQVLAAARRQTITGTASAIPLAEVPYNAATPSGLIAGVGADGNWTQILLGQNPPRQMAFCMPSAPLQQAFQTSQLFLVVANGAYLGAPSGADGPCGATAAFQNIVTIGDWKLAANVGKNNQYNDYRNVMIVKGRAGVLYDPGNKADSLVANPDKWTAKETLGAPSDSPGAAGNVGELAILSVWLQDYFGKAAESGDEAFANFNVIAKDPNWTGILFLRMDIAHVPDDLVGIMAGISNPSGFNAHHFGINISQILNQPGSQPSLNGASSMFGLIYYVDPAFTPPPKDTMPSPVPPQAGADYDFRLLMLKVQFANTAIQSFGSYAQITLNQFLDMPVVRMGAGGNAYNSIVLEGSYQNNSGRPVYSLGSTGDTSFYFQSNIVNKVEVTSAQMSTVNPGSAGSDVIAWFGLTGFIDFATVKDTSQNAFDILSFGSDANTDQPRKGLSFSAIGIRMKFPPDAPSQRTFEFDSSGIRFDIATSTPRSGSLYDQFALSLMGMVSGDQDSAPSSSGYADVVTAARLTGVAGGKWYGLRYQLSLGTPGDLAGKVGLNSYLLTAWAPDSQGDYKAQVGLQLPGTGGGAKLISLQTVLQLSIGQIVLAYDQKKNAFLLMMTEIALKVFGLLKLPPNGSTLFYLFGNPDAAGKASGLGWYAMYNNEPKVMAAGREG